MSKPGKKVFVKGYYGFGNFGDDIFCAVINWRLKNFTDYDPIFIGRGFPKGINYIKTKGNIHRNFLELYYSIRSKHIIFFGGSLFHSTFKKTDYRNLIAKLKLNKKTNAFGISVGPFVNERAELENLNFLNNLQAVFVRDNRSLKLSDNFKYSFDPAIIINEVYDIKPNIEKEIILGLNIGDFHTTITTQKKIMNFIKNKNINTVKVFILNKDDKKKSLIFTEMLKINNVCIEIIEYSNDLEDILNKMNECTFMIGERLHFGIISFALELPFILIEYHQKCTDFLEEINYPFIKETWNYIYDEREKLNINLKTKKEDKKNIFEKSIQNLEGYLR
ncbi:polysaccharide pyruvyl transferase family protein [Macrococcus caseolyticus]|uniref:polysaccharide pyruvyl transferase family protein n=1 Tax=Macrococcoides caseolyticum TaxID=69966 RepID=UPI0024BBF618|nr:polysaccharide pyruvyl transferase family protein [Macrococcus caseolyticus]MDJ1090133.1 polysaccharide pyruvyl transferase family protein [Macrococcus caseolyticus]